MISDPARVVAKLRLPAGIRGMEDAFHGLRTMYDEDLVIITDGPLWEAGWLIVATSPLPAEHGEG